MSYQGYNLSDMENLILGDFDKGVLWDADIEYVPASQAYNAIYSLIEKGLVRRVITDRVHYELTTDGQRLYNIIASEAS